MSARDELDRLADLIERAAEVRKETAHSDEHELRDTAIRVKELLDSSALGLVHRNLGDWGALATQFIQFMALAQLAIIHEEHERGRRYISHAQFILDSFAEGMRKGHAALAMETPTNGDGTN